MIKQFLFKLTNLKELEDNKVAYFIQKNINEILESEENYSTNIFVETETKKYIESGEIEDEEYKLEGYESQNIFSEKSFYLSKVDIKGIKGFSNINEICKDHTKSCQGPLINLYGNKSALVFGWNGDGKSSLIEGMEYCLTNDVEEAKRRNQKSLEKYLKNKNSKESVVEIEIFQPYEPPRLINIKKNLKEEFIENKGEDQVFLDLIKNNLEKFYDYNKKVFVEKNRLENFVLSSGKKQLDRYGQLIGLQEINDFYKKKWRNYKSEIKQDIYQKDSEYEDKEKKLYNKKKEIKNNNTKKPNKNNLNIKINDLNKSIGKNILDKDLSSSEIVNSKIKKLKKILNYFECKLNKSKTANQILEKYKEFEYINKRKNMIEKLLVSDDENIKTIKLYEVALELIDSEDTECPLCGGEKLYGDELISKLEKTLDSLNDLKKRRKELQEYSKKYNEKINELLNLYNNLFNTSITKEEITNKIENDNFKTDFNKYIINESSCIKNIDNIKSILSELNSYLDELKKYETLNKKENEEIEKIDEEIEKIKSKVEKEKSMNFRRKEIKNDLKEFQDVLDNYRTSYVAKELNDIADIILEYYNSFVTEYSFINLTLSPNGDNFFEASNEMFDKFDPLLILSEGQLRCFGLAILFAINKKINSNYMILDDIVNAIDVEHRKNIITTISNEISNNKQFIITTHDKLFREKLLNTLNKPSKMKTYYLDNLANLTLIDNTNKINLKKNIKELLEKNNCRAALMYMRLFVEINVYEIAEEQEIKLPFKDQQYKYNLSKVFDAVTEELEILGKVNKYIRAPLTWGLLNQENHYWSENAVCLDCQTLNEIFEATKILSLIRNILKCQSDLDELKIQIKEDKPKIEKFNDIEKLKSFGIINDEDWGEEYKELKHWID